MKKFIYATMFLAAIAFVIVIGVAVAQDPTKVAPDQYKSSFENDRVRVLEVRLKPGEKIPMHSHPDHLGYNIGAAKLRITNADGKVQDVDLTDGQVIWFDAVTHSAENTGSTEARIVVFELKK